MFSFLIDGEACMSHIQNLKIAGNNIFLSREGEVNLFIMIISIWEMRSRSLIYFDQIVAHVPQGKEYTHARNQHKA